MKPLKSLKGNVYTITRVFLVFAFLNSCSVNKNHQTQNEKAIDIVCGMKVDKSEAYISKYNGEKYYFDNINCKKAFDMNPVKFIDNKCVEMK